MKKTTILLQFLMLSAASFMQAQTFCAVTGTTGDGSVRNVAVVTTTGGSKNINYSGANGTDNYLLSTEIVTAAEGGVFNIAVTPGGSQASGVRFIVYIDWNGDKDFEDAGEIFLVSPEKTWTNPVEIFDMDITVPAGAAVGLTKMRILGGDSWAYNDDTSGGDTDGAGYPLFPCGQFNNTSWKDFSLEVTAKLGVDDFENNLQLAVFPNPIKGDAVNLRLNIQNQKLKVEIYNLVGKRVHSYEYKSFNRQEVLQLPSSLTKGLYMLKATLDNKTYIQRIIK